MAKKPTKAESGKPKGRAKMQNAQRKPGAGLAASLHGGRPPNTTNKAGTAPGIPGAPVKPAAKKGSVPKQPRKTQSGRAEQRFRAALPAIDALAAANAEPEAPLVPFHEIPHLKKRAFLAAFARTGNISRAAEAADVDRTTPFQWLKSDPQYKAAFDDAQKVAATLLEEEARRRATEGLRKLKFHEGQMIMVPAPDPTPENPDRTKLVPYVEHEYSDTLLIFLLKGNAPEKFKDRSEVKSELKAELTLRTMIIPAPTIAKLGEPPQARG